MVLQDPIDGVRLKDMRPVVRDNGILTEVWRRDWGLGGEVDQVFQRGLNPGAASAWHVHLETTDRLFIALGHAKVVLFDARPASPTKGRINEFRLGERRPGLLTVPPGVWHGVFAMQPDPVLLLNLVDKAYSYERPDHWTLPVDTKHIPYQG